MPERPPYVGRPAQPPGPTFLKYSPDGKRLLVGGRANFARSFNTGDLGEPDMVRNTSDETLALVCGNDYAVLGAEDGTVCQYQLPGGQFDKILVRSTLPIRDIALSPDGDWIAVSSDEIEVKVVNRLDMEQIVVLQDHPKPIKHLTYDPSGKYLTASCTDGVIYIYEMVSSTPSIFRTVDGVIRRLEASDKATSCCVWHPDGRAFACATATREIQVVSVEDGAHQRVFSGEHGGEITSLAWSPNGALLASASADDQLVIWETKTQRMLTKFNYADILHVTWHPHGENLFNWTDSLGQCFIIPGFLTDQHLIDLLQGPKVRSPFFHDPLDVGVNGVSGALVNGLGRPPRQSTPDSLDELLGRGSENGLAADVDGWIEDDDGAGYTNGNGKRTNGHFAPLNGNLSKYGRFSEWTPRVHPPFHPSSTPWRGNRRYLALNLTGFIWTVSHDTHHTITCEFYDREEHRDFHFTDPFLYDRACLNEKGALFSCPATPASGKEKGQHSMVFYRPHETWTNRADSASRITLPEGEDVTGLALADRHIVATTSAGYVRVYTLFGTPIRIWRQSVGQGITVTCSAHSNYVMTVSNGAVGWDGSCQLVYSIEDLRSGETLQSSDGVAVSDTADDNDRRLKNVFWSDDGNPCVYDHSGILLGLSNWRSMGQAKWVPLLDTKQLERLRDGRKEERYWPVAVAGERFHCIILKGGDREPYFPRPLLSEFELRVPIADPPLKKADDDTEAESNAAAGGRLEERFVRESLLVGFLESKLEAPGERAGHAQRGELARREVEVDKLLLQLLAVECREGEERGMKALALVELMRDMGGKMLDAASKVAGRWGHTVLEEKIRELGERRLLGADDD